MTVNSSVTFTKNDKVFVKIADLASKSSGRYSVGGCLKWITPKKERTQENWQICKSCERSCDYGRPEQASSMTVWDEA